MSVFGPDDLFEVKACGLVSELIANFFSDFNKGLACLFADLAFFRTVENGRLYGQVLGKDDRLLAPVIK